MSGNTIELLGGTPSQKIIPQAPIIDGLRNFRTHVVPWTGGKPKHKNWSGLYSSNSASGSNPNIVRNYYGIKSATIYNTYCDGLCYKDDPTRKFKSGNNLATSVKP